MVEPCSTVASMSPPFWHEIVCYTNSTSFSSFYAGAILAALPAVQAMDSGVDDTFQMTFFSACQATRFSPSERLPSVRERSTGYLAVNFHSNQTAMNNVIDVGVTICSICPESA
jgi:hypothetical protein